MNFLSSWLLMLVVTLSIGGVYPYLLYSLQNNNLPAPVTSIVRRYDHKMTFRSESLLQNSLATTLNSGTTVLDQSTLSIIAGQITEAIGLHGAVVAHRHFQFTLEDSAGKLKICEVNVYIRGNDIHILGGVVQVAMNVPTVYNQEEVCRRTGHRRYGLFGPRSRECNYINVQRGLHAHEIELVRQKLVSTLPAALKMLQ